MSADGILDDVLENGTGRVLATARPNPSRIPYTRASSVTPQPIRPIWRNRFIRGKFNLAAGPGGRGKTLLMADMAARVSTGTPWPDLRDEPTVAADVLIANCEDDIRDTLVPRLIACDANLDRIHFLEPVDLRKQAGELEKLIRWLIKTGAEPALLIVDPMTAFFPTVDGLDNMSVRSAIAPLIRLIDQLDIALVGVTHTRKSNGMKVAAADTVLGSVAWVNAARTVWIVDHEQGDRDRKLVLPAKDNVLRQPTGLAFAIRERDGVPQVHWEPEVLTTMHADDLHEVREQAPRVAEAADFLRAFLRNGPRLATEVEAQAKDNGITEYALKAARKRLGIVAKTEGFQGRTYLSLPEDGAT